MTDPRSASWDGLPPDPMTREDPVSPSVEAAWLALGREFAYAIYDRNEVHDVIARHRPLIEAALAASPADGAVADATISETSRHDPSRPDQWGKSPASDDGERGVLLSAFPADGAGVDLDAMTAAVITAMNSWRSVSGGPSLRQVIRAALEGASDGTREGPTLPPADLDLIDDHLPGM